MGRFLNADSYASTGQGVIGHNVFAYCNNNPANRVDLSGNISDLLLICGVSAAISGLANAVSTAITGGTTKDCIVAGLCGAIGGVAGALVGTCIPIDPLRGAILGRAVATIVTDISTSGVLNGEISAGDIVWTAVDITMDMTLSTIGYYYNPIDDIIKQTAVNAFADGSFDVAQSYLYLSPSHSTPANGGIVSSTGTASNRNGRTYEYAHKKVGILLGII